MRKALAAVAVAVTTVTVVAAPSPAISADSVVTQRYAAFHWNVSGHVMNRNSTTNGMVKAAVDAVLNPKHGVNDPAPAVPANTVDMVSFNEICYDQFDEIRKELAAAGWTVGDSTLPTGRFVQGVPANTIDHDRVTPVCGGGEFGMALFSKHGLGEPELYQLPVDGNAYRDTKGRSREAQHWLACAPLADQPRMKFCTTHITGSSTTANPRGLRQIEAVRARLDQLAANGDTYLVAGDFNAQPSYGRLNQMYSPSLAAPQTSVNTGNYGSHRELDDLDTRCPGYGEATSARNPDPTQYMLSPCGNGLPPSEGGELPKIDMIFVREDQLAATDYNADALAIPTGCGGPCSDHNVVTGRVSLKVRATG